MLKTPSSTIAAPIPSLTVRMEPHFVEGLWDLVRLTRQKGNLHTEICGLLFGKANSGMRSVNALKTFADTGTHSDLARRERLERAYLSALAEAKDDAELASLQVVGWFSFRNAGGLLSSDVVFHIQHFRRLEDLALIVWRDSPSQITAEFYSKSDNNTFTDDDYRCNWVRLSADERQPPESVELIMGAKPDGDSYPRQYDDDQPQFQFATVMRTVEAVTGKLFAFLPKRKEEEFMPPLMSSTYDNSIYDSPLYDRRLTGRASRPTEAAGDPIPNAHFDPPAGPSADAPEPLGSAGQGKPAAARAAAAGAFPSMPTLSGPAAVPPSRADWRSNPGALPEPPKRPLTGLGQELRDVGYRSPAGLPATAELSGLPVLFQQESPASKPYPWLWAAALFVVTSAAVFAVLLLGGLPSDGGRLGQSFLSVFRGSDLNLNVASFDDHLRLTWNKSHPAVAAAVDGTLQIVDGTDHREVHMDPRQLADGFVLYRPLTNDVTFRLEVHGRQGAAEGSVRVLDGAGSQQALAFSEPRPKSVKQPTLSQDWLADSSPGAPPDPSSYPLIRPNTVASASPPITDTPVTKLPHPVRPTAARRTETTQLSGAQAESPGSTINGWDTAGSKSGARQRVAKAEPSSAGFVGPRPLIQVMPRTSAIPSGAIQSRTRVEVQVHVDPAGKVAAARVVGTAVNQSIAAAAVAAARQWTFVPASSNGQHVESDHTIVFEFRPQR